MIRRKLRKANVKYMLAGGSMVAALNLLLDPGKLLPNPAPKTDICQEMVQQNSVLSRESLTKLLTVAERSKKATIRQIVPVPYCRLQDLQVRAGTTAQREAYPLAFDPQTWFVVLYEGDEYAGYSFSFRH